MEQFVSLLNRIHPLSSPLIQFFKEKIKTQNILKRQFLLKPGNVGREIYFIKRGLVRSYYIEGKQEVCSKFMREGDFIVSAPSFFEQKESYEFVQAVEDSQLLYLTYDELQYIYKNFTEFNLIGRILITKAYLLSEQRLFFMRMKQAPTRYKMMVEHFPQLILRLPAKYIASYLGIGEETLSRIRSSRRY
ncbi:MAG TPA: Crp/Fnr family transcriptional regulator [Chitinophagaceae bacterium]